MTYELTGTMYQISNTQHVSDKFRKREFVIEIVEEINGSKYTNYVKFQTAQAKCDSLDIFRVGETVKVSFNIKGNKWERDGKLNFITNLDAWKVEKQTQTSHVQPYAQEPNNQGGCTPSLESADDLPF